MNKNKREELRMKTGRSKRCLLCQNHRCIIASCQCECHKDYSGRLVPRTPRHIPTKRNTKLKKSNNSTSLNPEFFPERFELNDDSNV